MEKSGVLDSLIHAKLSQVYGEDLGDQVVDLGETREPIPCEHADMAFDIGLGRSLGLEPGPAVPPPPPLLLFSSLPPVLQDALGEMTVVGDSACEPVPVPSVYGGSACVDIEGWTHLCRQLSLLQAGTLLHHVLPVAIEATRQHEGWVVKLLGDGVLCWFWDPAQRRPTVADRMARWTRDVLATCRDVLSRELMTAGLPPVRLSIGAEVGEHLMVRGYPSDALDVIGDPVNQSAKLQQAARGYQALFGERASLGLSPELSKWLKKPRKWLGLKKHDYGELLWYRMPRH